MPWKTPPPEIRDRVNRELGYDIYAASAAAWLRARKADPDVVLNSWFRTPEEHYQLPGAATYSQHLLGLAVDVKPSPGRRKRLQEALVREGFHVIPRPTYLHVQRLAPPEALRLRELMKLLGIVRVSR